MPNMSRMHFAKRLKAALTNRTVDFCGLGANPPPRMTFVLIFALTLFPETNEQISDRIFKFNYHFLKDGVKKILLSQTNKQWPKK